MPNKYITVENVSKSYKGARRSEPVRALQDVSFDVGAGEIFGLIGPDGAGKTSMMRIVATLIIADLGRVAINGLDVKRDYREIRKRVGYMPGRFSLYYELSVEENLTFFAKVFGVKIKDNIDLVKDIYMQIEPFKDRPAGKLSGGMKQKLALCCALIHRPEVLILDEPTTGVDPVSRQELWNILADMKKHGIAILASTPYMDEASRCDNIAFIVKGKILKTDSPNRIIGDFSQKILHVKSADMFELLSVLRSNPHIESAYAFGNNNHVVLKSGTAEDIRKFLIQNGHSDAKVEEAEATLEDCFMSLNDDHD